MLQAERKFLITMRKNKIISIISWVAVILWMLLIFSLSSQVAEQSSKLSTGVTEIIMTFLQKIVPITNLDMESLSHIVRKNAHFIAYLVLGILVMNALRKSGKSGLPAFIFAMGICVLYAISDEVHQLYVPGRSGQALDVIIDSSGALAGTAFYLLIGRKLSKVIEPR